MYTDDVIKTEVSIDNQNEKRRLYMGNEFDTQGIAISLDVVCEKKAICGPDKINIIEGSTGEKVTLLDNGKINVALSKTIFANMILEEKIPFNNVDFESFIEIFNILNNIFLDDTNS